MKKERLKVSGTSQRPGAFVVHCKDSAGNEYELPLQSAQAALISTGALEAIQNWHGDPATSVMPMPVVKVTTGAATISGKQYVSLRLYVTATNYHDYFLDPTTESAKIVLALGEQDTKGASEAKSN